MQASRVSRLINAQNSFTLAEGLALLLWFSPRALRSDETSCSGGSANGLASGDLVLGLVHGCAGSGAGSLSVQRGSRKQPAHMVPCDRTLRSHRIRYLQPITVWSLIIPSCTL